MGVYVDGFVVPVPADRVTEYKKLASKMGKLWIKHGALEVHECVADDVKPGKLTSFPQSVKLKEGEVVVFSWIVFRSRRQRDAINKKVMAEPSIKDIDMTQMPMDGKRMFWGGFKAIVSLKA